MKHQADLRAINDEFGEVTHVSHIGEMYSRLLPYINTSNITLLHKGMHKIPGREYYGLTAQHRKHRLEGQSEYRVFLCGFFGVEEDCIVVPEGMELTEKEIAFIEQKEKEGFKRRKTKPVFDTIEYGPETPEYALGLQINREYKADKKITGLREL